MSEYENTIDMPDGTGCGGYKTFAEITKNSRERAARENRLTWNYVFEEAACAVLAETDPNELIKKLDRLGDVALDWQLALTDQRIRNDGFNERFKEMMTNKEQK